MLVIIISLLITIASFYVMAYIYKIDHNSPKVTVGDVFDEYSVLIVLTIIPGFNVGFFVIFAGILLCKILKDVKVL